VEAACVGTSQYTPASPISGAVSEQIHSGDESGELRVWHQAGSTTWQSFTIAKVAMPMLNHCIGEGIMSWTEEANPISDIGCALRQWF
jgi:hypothetical protein